MFLILILDQFGLHHPRITMNTFNKIIKPIVIVYRLYSGKYTVDTTT